MRRLLPALIFSGLVILAIGGDVLLTPRYYVPRVLFAAPTFVAAYFWNVRRTLLVACIALLVFMGALVMEGADAERIGIAVGAMIILGISGCGFSVINSRERDFQAQLQRRKHELSLEQSRLRAAMTASRITLLTQDTDLRINWIGNASWMRPGALLGRTDYDLFGPDDAEKLASLKRRVLRDGVAHREVIDLPLDGSTRNLEVFVEPLRGSGNELLGVTVAAVDISAITRLLRDEQAARQDADSARARLEHFALAAAHDLRQPLTTIIGTLHLLRTRLEDLPENCAQYFEMIADSSHHMNLLLSDLYDAGTLGSVEYRISPQRTDLMHVIRSAVTAVTSGGSAHPIQITGPPELIGAWDPDRLAQLMTNLVSNAIKFSPPVAPISIVAQQEDGACRCEVNDEGSGIPIEERQRVFEPFHRLESTSQIPGTGLGLFICGRIVAAHGGRIWIETAPGGTGSSVIFRLPLTSQPPVS